MATGGSRLAINRRPVSGGSAGSTKYYMMGKSFQPISTLAIGSLLPNHQTFGRQTANVADGSLLTSMTKFCWLSFHHSIHKFSFRKYGKGNFCKISVPRYCSPVYDKVNLPHSINISISSIHSQWSQRVNCPLPHDTNTMGSKTVQKPMVHT